MIKHELYLDEPTDIEKAAEVASAHVRENLCKFIQGERASFNAYFPLNLETHGEGKGVNDISHDIFYNSLPIEDIESDYLVLKNGIKLYYSHLIDDDTEIPFSAHYSSEPITMSSTVYHRQIKAGLTSSEEFECRIANEFDRLRDIGRTAFNGLVSASQLLNIDRETFGWGTKPTTTSADQA